MTWTILKYFKSKNGRQLMLIDCLETSKTQRTTDNSPVSRLLKLIVELESLISRSLGSLPTASGETSEASDLIAVNSTWLCELQRDSSLESKAMNSALTNLSQRNTFVHQNLSHQSLIYNSLKDAMQVSSQIKALVVRLQIEALQNPQSIKCEQCRGRS